MTSQQTMQPGLQKRMLRLEPFFLSDCPNQVEKPAPGLSRTLFGNLAALQQAGNNKKRERGMQ